LEISLYFAFSYESQCPEPQQCNRRRFGNRHGTAKAAVSGFVAGEHLGEAGRLLTETIVSRLAVLAEKMSTWDDKMLESFIDAEAALVTKQLLAPKGKNNLWSA
jgi:hypothetical protein